MRNVLQLAGLLFLTACSQGSTERWLPPEEVVQRYSRTVACQIPNNSPNYRQYVTIPLDPGSNEGGFGALWLVGWLAGVEISATWEALAPMQPNSLS